MFEIIGFIASFCVGLILGLIGGGGSILCIPILVYLFSVEVVEATAYSLFIVGVTAFVGSVQRHRNALVDLRVGLTFGFPCILSKFVVRKWVVPAIPDLLLQTESFVVTKRFFMLGLFSVLVILAASAMILKTGGLKWHLFGKGELWLGIQGAIIGLLTGLTGLGGGFIIVPTLIFFSGISFKRAVGTALFIIALSSMIGFTGDLSNLQVDWALLGMITVIAIVGIFTGNLLSKRISGLYLQKSFGWFILMMGIAILIKESYG